MKKRVNKKINTEFVKQKTKNIKKKLNSNKTKSKLLNIIIIGILVLFILIILFSAFIIINAPKFDPNNLKFTMMSEVYDKDGNIISKMGNENRTEISYDNLPEVLIDAIIATEDSKFFQHNGFDLARFVKASLGQALGRDSGGASTITMQIVKNNYTSTVSSGIQGIIRKFTDIYLSIFKVEKKYTKKEIIEFYINDSYLGNGAYGVEQASLNYFGKSVSELNLAEASFIAGLFQSPTYYNPYNYPEKAESRRKTVLYLMKRHGYITEEERKAASSKQIKDLVQKTQVDSSYSKYQGYIDTVVEELEEEYGVNPYTTPIKIYTAMNPSKQDFINKVMNGEAWTWENDSVQAGVVMTESNTGEVIAVGAGRNKNTQRSYNYATMSNRHIGSTAKPIFDYGPAVEYLGWGTVNYIEDSPHQYSDGNKIANSDNSYYGTLPMYRALGLSRNITALKTFQQVSKEVGNDKIIKFATSLGITPEIEGGKIHEAHSIGSFTGSTKKGESRNSPMTMAGAYQAFSNGGYYIKPHTIRKFIYKETEEVVENKTQKKQVMYDSTAYIISYALNWSATGGLARTAAGISGVSVAAKTGTSNIDYQTLRKYGISSSHVNDLWVCGYTPSQTLTFWYGYDTLNKAHYSTTATWNVRDRFYRNLAENLFDKTGETFKAPSSIKTAYVAKNSNPLKLAADSAPDSSKELGYFRKGTEPTEKDVIIEKNLKNVSNITSTVSDNKITLKWTGLSAEDILNYDVIEGYGDIGYDIYIKDGKNGKETYVATTSSTTYTHTTSLKNPVYVIYTAYKNYKNNKSSGVSHNVTMPIDFDVTIGSCEITSTDDISACNKYLIILYNSVDVTDEATIKTTKTSDTSVRYDITYKGKTKTVTGQLSIKNPIIDNVVE